jgi:uncharacterized protein
LFTGKTFHLMKRKPLPQKLTLLAAAVTIFVAAFTAFAQETPWSQNVSPLPTPSGFVNDYAGVIDAGTKQQLETKLKTLTETTDPPVEIAVAVVKTTGDRDIFDYSLAVARGWGIGAKKDDNPSALLFIAIDDRKYFTQVSRDLEDELPDGLVGSLQRQYLVPEFKKGNYGKGIADTIDAYIDTVRNKGNVPVNQNTAKRVPTGTTGGGLLGLFCCAGIVLIIVIIILSRSKGGPSKGDRDRWGGGGDSGVSSALPWIIGSIISSGLSSGSSSSSGDSWGGSSGGFGGFGGGGDFGGGGAGGSW